MVPNEKAFSLFLIILSLPLVSPTPSTATIPIAWEIQNRYRAFDYLEIDGKTGPEESATILKQFLPTPEEISDTDKGSAKWFMRVSQMQSPFSRSSGPWIEKAGVYRGDFVDLPQMLAVKARLKLDPEEADSYAGRQCSWQIQTMELEVKPCDQPIEIENFHSAGAEITVYEGDNKVASESIVPGLKIIIGLGDSYASGEGSPDRPTKWKKGKVRYWPPYHTKKVNDHIDSGASWWSNRCDRSFYSYQNLVALRHAVEEKHSVVAFVHLACSGAEIVDGLLAPQRQPPGHPTDVCKAPKDRSKPTEFDPRCDVPYSQLHAAIKLLCRKTLTQLTSEQMNKIRAPLKRLKYGPNQWEMIQNRELVSCPNPNENLRGVDHILLSIGGNDIGFAGIIAYTLMPDRTRLDWIPAIGDIAKYIVDLGQQKGGAVCVYTRKDKECAVAENIPADIRLREIHKRYKALGLAMNYMLGTKHAIPVILNQYPNPLIGLAEKRCANVQTKDQVSSMENSWRALRLKGIPDDWQVNLLHGESEDIELRVINKLNEAIAKVPAIMEQLEIPSMLSWKIAHLQGSMLSHGWCEGENIRFSKFDAPSNWEPNFPNKRYVRTGNDSFLTQWPDKERDNGFNGTFHPNPQGYGAMAEGVLQVVNGLKTVAQY
mgnify:CR=1 FL=1